MSLEQRLQEFYAEQRLSDDEVDAILAAQPNRQPRQRIAWVAATVGLAAAAALALVLLHPTEDAPHESMVIADPVEPEPELAPVVAGPQVERGALEIATRPAGAEVYVDGIAVGLSPVTVDGLVFGTHLVRVVGETGSQTLRVVIDREEPLELTLDLRGGESLPPRPNAKRTKDTKCDGPSAQLSVMPVGEHDCWVWVGNRLLEGTAPFFKKLAPSGTCEVRINCPNGKWHQATLQLEPGEDTKLIVKPGDWKGGQANRKGAQSRRERSKSRASSSREGPADAKAVYEHGIQALKAGRNREAIDRFSECIQLNREFCLCYRAMGITYARWGKGPRAYKAYKRYLEVCPTARDRDAVRKLLRDYESTK